MHLLWWEVALRFIHSSSASDRLQLSFLSHNTFVEDLPVKAGVRASKVVHILECLFQLGLIYFSEAAKLVIWEAKSVGSIEKCHSLVFVLWGVGDICVEKFIAYRLISCKRNIIGRWFTIQGLSQAFEDIFILIVWDFRAIIVKSSAQ